MMSAIKYHLNNPMANFQYMRIHLKDIPHELVVEYYSKFFYNINLSKTETHSVCLTVGGKTLTYQNVVDKLEIAPLGWSGYRDQECVSQEHIRGIGGFVQGVCRRLFRIP